MAGRVKTTCHLLSMEDRTSAAFVNKTDNGSKHLNGFPEQPDTALLMHNIKL